jgi:hypothetical protein
MQGILDHYELFIVNGGQMNKVVDMDRLLTSVTLSRSLLTTPRLIECMTCWIPRG